MVLGDLCMDTIVDTPVPTWRDGGEKSYWVPMSDRPGGSAYFFALNAATHGFEPTVVGSVGADRSGVELLDDLVEKAVRHHIQTVPGVPTARTCIAFDEDSTRIMFASNENANSELSPEFVDQIWGLVPTPDAMWLSGLCLRDRTSKTFSSVVSLLQHAHREGVHVALDIVPHHFHQYFASIEELLECIGPISVLVSELSSVYKLVGTDSSAGDIHVNDLERMAAELLSHFPTVVLRHRAGSEYHQILAKRDGKRFLSRYPLHGGHTPPGYGDRMTCDVLRSAFGFDERKDDFAD